VRLVLAKTFAKSIISAIERTDVVLAFIGKNWTAQRSDSDAARIWDPDDYVRAELSAALARPILVIPILVDGARMAEPDLLPPDIRAITKRNALTATT
jgi:hypothetical protein